MTTWGTTTYAVDDRGATTETHRDLTLAELRHAVYAVEASDNGGRSYSSNGLRWVREQDARSWAFGLTLRWFGCTNVRVVRVTPPPMGAACGCTARPIPHTDDEHPGSYTVVEVVEQTL